MKQILKTLPAFLILILGICLSFWIHSLYKKRALNDKENKISAVVENNYRNIQKELNTSFSSVEILQYLFEDQENISKEEFKNFTAPILKADASIKALSWVPKITNEKRANFENEIIKELNFKTAITQLNDQKKIVKREEQPFYFPVTYIEPFNENKNALAFDLYSENVRKQTIDSAINKGKIVITPRISLVQDTARYSFLGISAVYYASNNPKTIENVKGLISTVFEFDILINEAIINSKDSKIAIVIFDVTNNKKELIYGNEAPLGKTDQYTSKKTLAVGGRIWELNFIIDPVYYQIADIKSYLIGGIAISFLLFLLLLVPFFKERRKQILTEKLFQEQKVRVHTQQSLSESEEKYRFMFANNPQPMWIYDLETLAFLEINNAAINHYGYSREEFLSMAIKDIRPKEDIAALLKNIEQVSKTHSFSGEWRHLKKNGEIINVEITSHLITFNGHKARHVMVNDITEWKRLELLRNSEKHLLEIITQNAPLPKILEEIVLSVEALSENTIASILLLDDEGIHVHYGAAPHLPEGYNNALEGASIGPNAGSCGTAAYRKEPVIVADIEVDPLWDNYRELARAHGLSACWSTPIINLKGKVLGTFAMYYREPRSPKDEDFKLIEKATHLAEIAIERKQAEELLIVQKEQYHSLVQNIPIGVYKFRMKPSGEMLFEFISPRMCEILKIEAEEAYLDFMNAFKIIHPDELDDFIKQINDIYQNPQNFNWEGRAVINTEIKWFRIESNPTILENGDIVWDGFIKDITDRKQAEEALKHSEKKFKYALMNAPFPILIHAENGEVVLVNDTWEELTGYSQEEIPTIEKWTELAYGEKMEVVKEDINLLYEIDSRKEEGEYEILTKNGKKLVWLFSSAPIGKDLGGNRLVISMAIDITARKKVEEEIKRKEQILKLFIENAPASIAMFDREMKYISVSRRFLNDYGLDKENMIGHSHYEIFPEISERWKNIHKRCLAGAIEKEDEDIFPRADGKLDYVRWEIRPWHESQGEIGGIILFSEVITEKKQAEEKLRLSNQTIRNIVDYSPSLIYIFNLKGEFLLANKNFEKLLGISQEELLGQTREKFFSKKVAEQHRNNDLKVINSKQTIFFEEENMEVDGKHFYLTSKFPLFDTEGNIYAVGGISTDITDRKKAEEEIYDTNRELQMLNNTILTLIGTSDLNMTLNKVLEAALEVVGLEGGTICLINPDNTFNLVTERAASKETIEDFTNNKVKIGECLCGNCALDCKPLILQTKEEVLKYATREVLRGEDIRFHASYPFVVGGKSAGILCVFTRTDAKPSTRKLKLLETIVSQTSIIIENIRLYEEIGNQNINLENMVSLRTKQLESVNKELQTFTYSVSHDLKAPLRGIDGYSNLLQELYSDSLNEEAQNFIRSIRNGTKQMNMLIGDLLDYSRLERSTLRIEPIKISELLKLLKSQFETEISSAKCAFSIKVPDIEIVADMHGLTIALRNLIENAIKFSGEQKKPAVEISLKNKPNHWLLAVKDNGIGFDMKYKDRIFEIFQQLNLPEEFPGTGIGLAMVHKSMEKMGGKVWAESKLGEGSVFYLEIPKQLK